VQGKRKRGMVRYFDLKGRFSSTHEGGRRGEGVQEICGEKGLPWKDWEGYFLTDTLEGRGKGMAQCRL